jgi:hypothetical protein
MKARTPPWHRVPPIVIDAIFEALDDTELFDCFVQASMENQSPCQLTRLKLTAIRDQLDNLIDEAGRQEFSRLSQTPSRSSGSRPEATAAD